MEITRMKESPHNKIRAHFITLRNQEYHIKKKTE